MRLIPWTNAEELHGDVNIQIYIIILCQATIIYIFIALFEVTNDLVIQHIRI